MSATSDRDTATHYGATARRPTDITLKGYWQITKRIAGRFKEDRLGLVAAGVAFYALLALFPGLTALVELRGLFISPAELAETSESLAIALPDAAQEIVMGQLTELSNNASSGLSLAAIFGIGLAIFSASKGVSNLMVGLNIAYAETEERGFIRLQLTIFALTAFAVIASLTAITLLAVLPAAFALLPLPSRLEDIVSIVRWPVLFALVAAAFTVFYRFGASRRPAKWRWVAPGGVSAVVIWIAASLVFSIYVQTFATYSETFGALAGAVILLLWLWISSLAVLFGAVIDAELEAQVAPDSTTGAPRDMGDRGATKADICQAGPDNGGAA
ncbi:YihY/virulence factor BrkB family protein [Rhodobacteraceae bacterium N5(2021)]|uniref:YihY/virulence factor BrkB family protein n=1 Tax=Gymnodinialimonas phycosphaerae TaxID=2841589 RepID=A0A975TY49_9RHOB|nr:YihY/virulence factor BrkB family protein [Gymnodinialimonas phycosphaerae]MBY4892869.1 YihY/virulence factor BrkB family protein [Gymnodinialimonas phycosphaerae]